jgi:hypothetical protein
MSDPIGGIGVERSLLFLIFSPSSRGLKKKKKAGPQYEAFPRKKKHV